MQQQIDFVNEYQLLFAHCNPTKAIYHKALDLLHKLKKTPHLLQQFLEQVTAESIGIINISILFKYLRTLVRVVRSQPQLRIPITNFVVKVALKYLPYHVSTKGEENLLIRFASLISAQSMVNLDKDSNHNALLLALKSGHKQVGQYLLARIQNQVFVDKKNKTFKALRLNTILGGFIAENFKVILPSLERLLIRSQSNLDIWRDVAEVIKSHANLEPFALETLKIIKDFLITQSAFTIDIVKNMTSALKSPETIASCVEFLDKILISTPDDRKKIIIIQMFEGLIKSASTLQDDQEILQKILVVLIKCFSRINQQPLFVQFVKILNLVLEHKTTGSKIILDQCKLQVKGFNKYPVHFVSLVLSKLYSNSDVKQQKPLLQISKEYQKLYNASKAKIVVNLENYLSSVYLLTSLQIKTEFPELLQPIYLNNFNFLSTKSYNRDFLLKVLINLFKTSPEIPEQRTSVFFTIFLIAACNHSNVKLISSLSPNILIKLLTEGAFPLFYHDIAKQFSLNPQTLYNLIKLILSSIDLENTDFQNSIDWARVMVVSSRFKQLKKALTHFSEHEDSIKQSLQANLLQSVHNLLQKDAWLKSDDYKDFNLRLIKTSIELGLHQSLDKYFEIFLVSPNYTNIKCLEEFEETLKQSKQSQETVHHDQIELLKQLAFLRQPIEEKKKAKKGQIGVKTQDFKMLDENQVKIEKLRKHFVNMEEYYRLLHPVVTAFVATPQQALFCDKFYFSYLSCMMHSELRFQFYLFNKQLFSKQPVFCKYSSFLADLFVKVGSDEIPKDSALEKFYVFESDLLSMDFKTLPLHIINLFELVNSYLLKNLEFDVNLKMYAVKFYLRVTEDARCEEILRKIYPHIINNINLLSSHEETKTLLARLMKVIKPENYTEILDQILTYLPNSKNIILHSLIQANNPQYVLSFEDYVKLRILELENDQEISEQAEKLLSMYVLHMDVDKINQFDMKKFVERHSKDTAENLCRFAKQCFTVKAHIAPMFTKVLTTAEELYKQNFDEEGLQFLPYFLEINIDFIQVQFFKKIFQILIMQFTNNEQLIKLNKLALQAGISIIKTHGANNSQTLLTVLQYFLKFNKGISNVVFLGVLAPFLKDNKNLSMIEKRVSSLFESDNYPQQKAISKCMPDLMSFFKQPQRLVKNIFQKLFVIEGFLQVGQAYLIAGLLNGIGINDMCVYLNKILENYESSKQVNEKKGRLYLLNAFLDNHGRVLETKIIPIMKLIIHYMSDNNESVRDTSKQVASSIMNKLSAYAVKKLLPELLSGLSRQQNWRGKVTYIWALGNMAHCAPKQLQACLPKIVPTLSACLSDTHPKIRQNATEALKVIGETIKNPEIFASIDILINALSDPFDNSKRGLQVLLKTRFSHFIDPPALSIIVPIIDYALRGRNSELKVAASQVIGSISVLIENPDDLLPYIEFINIGLKVTVCDPLADIRAVATKALGKMSAKIGIQNTEKQLKFLLDILESQTANSIQRQGAAQGYSECICSHGFQYFEECLNRIYERLKVAKSTQKEGYISIFIYVPAIMKTQFEPFIKEVTENMYVFVSDEQESIRNASLQVQKILINNFGLSHTQMLLEPLCDGLFEEKWRKRNGALILIGQMLNVLKNHLYTNQDEEKEFNYYQGLMGVYILKEDEVEMPRITAGQVWNTYIDNTPKTLKMGLGTLVKMWVRGIKQPAANIALRSITGFSAKYGQNYFYQILDYFKDYLRGDNDALKSGVYDVFAEFLKRISQQFLLKIKEDIRGIFEVCLFTHVDQIRRSLVKALSIYVEKMHESQYLEQKLYPELDKIEQFAEQNDRFINLLHLFGEICTSSSRQIIESVLKKIMTVPLSEFRIQVITNNAVKLSNFLYTFFEKRPATEMLKDEIINEINLNKDNTDTSKLKSLIYCFNQISINLNEKHKGVFIQSLAADISVYSKVKESLLTNSQRKILETLLEVLLFFLNGTPAELTGNLEDLIRQITPLAFAQNKSMLDLINQIFSNLFANPNKVFAANYFKQFGVCLENQILESGLQGSLPIWKDSESAKVYVNIFINTLVYGGLQLFDDTLVILIMFFKYAPQNILDDSIQRIVGILIRLTNYRLTFKQKMKLQALIQNIYERKFKLSNYTYQMQSALLRFLIDTRKQKQAVHQCSTNMILLLQSSPRRNQILLELSTKVHFYGETLAICLYYIIKKTIKSDLIAPNTYQKITLEFSNYLNQKQTKLSVPALYYISKTASRISAFVKKPWKFYQDLIQGVTCPYTNMLQYLHFSYYSENVANDYEKINIFIKQSNREKVAYLLKSIKLLTKKYDRLREVYNTENTQKLVSQTILGFEEIDDMLKSL